MKKFLIFLFLILIFVNSGCSSKVDLLPCNHSENKDDCFFELGVNEDNLFLCSKIENNTLRIDCKSLIEIKKEMKHVLENPEITKDISSCVILEKEDKEVCILTKAKMFPNPIFCNQIETDYIRIECLNYLYEAGDVILESCNPESYSCEEVNVEEAKDNCYYALGTRYNDEKVCTKIINGVLRNKCFSAVSSGQELFKLQQSLCKTV